MTLVVLRNDPLPWPGHLPVWDNARGRGGKLHNPAGAVMAWERRKRGASTGYFYAAIRVGDRVTKIYHGRGQAGHEAAAELELRRKGRLEAKKLLQDARNDADEADRLAAELREWGEGLQSVWLILTGHRKRRGQWRRTSRG